MKKSQIFTSKKTKNRDSGWGTYAECNNNNDRENIRPTYENSHCLKHLQDLRAERSP